MTTNKENRRCAIAGIGTESCTFSQAPTTLSDFVVDRGRSLITGNRYPFFSTYNLTPIPLLRARALPGGPVSAAAYETLKTECLARLAEAMPVDCVYLDMHGAMVVEGLVDAEADWFAAIRKVVGSECLIGASFDLHGNLTKAACNEIDLLSAFRTAPHIDELETREKTVGMLAHCLREETRPTIQHIAVPVLFSGEQTSTSVDPAAALYAQLASIDATPSILDASIFMGYPWADDARAGASIAITGFSPSVAATHAARLANEFWNKRHDFSFGVPAGSMDWCIQEALTAEESCIFISDSGDNPTAGAPGDVPFALRCLLAQGVQSAVVASITDPAAVQVAIAAGVNKPISISLGGKLDKRTDPPLEINAQAQSLHRNHRTGGDMAVLVVQGVTTIVTSKRRPFHFISDFLELGVDPLAQKMVVIKIGYLEPDLAAAAPKALLALTPGCVDQDIPRLPFRSVTRPIFPLDPDMSWQA